MQACRLVEELIALVHLLAEPPEVTRCGTARSGDQVPGLFPAASELYTPRLGWLIRRCCASACRLWQRLRSCPRWPGLTVQGCMASARSSATHASEPATAVTAAIARCPDLRRQIEVEVDGAAGEYETCAG